MQPMIRYIKKKRIRRTRHLLTIIRKARIWQPCSVTNYSLLHSSRKWVRIYQRLAYISNNKIRVKGRLKASTGKTTVTITPWSCPIKGYREIRCLQFQNLLQAIQLRSHAYPMSANLHKAWRSRNQAVVVRLQLMQLSHHLGNRIDFPIRKAKQMQTSFRQRRKMKPYPMDNYSSPSSYKSHPIKKHSR